MHRFALWVFLALAAGRAPASPADWCLYFVDAKDGNVYRSRVDGSHRELVIRSRVKVRPHGSCPITFALAWPDATHRGELHLTNIPAQEGFTVLDAAGKMPFGDPMPMRFRDQIGTAPLIQAMGIVPYSDTGQASGWRLTFEAGRNLIELGHSHDYLAEVTLHKGKISRSYKLSERDYRDGPMALFSDDTVLLRDGKKVVWWNLRTDSRKVVAAVHDAAVWHRDLRDPERYKPLAKALVRNASGGLAPGAYVWAMKDPDDFRPKPEYRKQR